MTSDAVQGLKLIADGLLIPQSKIIIEHHHTLIPYVTLA